MCVISMEISMAIKNNNGRTRIGYFKLNKI